MSQSHDITSFENFSEEELILAIKQGNPAAQEYVIKKYKHEIFQILKPLAAKGKNMKLLFTKLISRFAEMITEADDPYKFTLLTVLIQAATTMINTIEQNAAATPLSVYFDMSQFTTHEIADIAHLLSDTYRSVGGDELVIKKIDFLDFSPINQS